MKWSMFMGALGMAALSLSALHVILMGYEGWLTPREWHGDMPPSRWPPQRYT